MDSKEKDALCISLIMVDQSRNKVCACNSSSIKESDKVIEEVCQVLMLFKEESNLENGLQTGNDFSAKKD